MSPEPGRKPERAWVDATHREAAERSSSNERILSLIKLQPGRAISDPRGVTTEVQGPQGARYQAARPVLVNCPRDREGRRYNLLLFLLMSLLEV